MIKRHLLFTIFASFFVFLLYSVSANAETEGNFTYTVNNNEAVITEITPISSDKIVIPDTLGGYPVTGLQADRMMESGDYVVDELVIPAGITEINSHPFVMAKLARITVDENNPAFSSADGVLLDKTQTKLIKCPAYYPERAYTVPATVTEIGWGAFSNAKTLETVVLPEGVTTLGNQAFAFTGTIKNIKIPDTVTVIEQNCFAYNNAIERIVVPESVTTLSMSAFTDCISLQAAVILANITTLNTWMFDNTALKTVVLPATLTTIMNDVFVRTNGLERILFAGTQEQWDAISVGSNNGSFPEAEVLCDFPAAAYKNIEVTEENGMVKIEGSGYLPGSLNTTYHYWDDYAETAETVYLNGDFTEIGSNSFVNFPSLSSVIIRSNGITMDAGAFKNCENLKNLIFLGGSTFSEDSYVNCGEEMNFFAVSEYPQGYNDVSNHINYISVSYADGMLHYDGKVVQDSYDFFDIISVFCDRYGEINELQVKDFEFTDIPVYYYNAVSGARTRINDSLRNCTIYPQVVIDGENKQITYNALCSGIADGSISGFYLVINDEQHPEIQDTPISIVEQIVSGIRKVLRAIVTLLNKLFRLLKSFGG